MARKKGTSKKAPAKKAPAKKKTRVPKSSKSPGGSKGGRPPYEPTQDQRDEVEALIGYGLGEREIADFMGIARNTLRAHFPLELKTGKLKANAKVAQSLFRRATDPKGGMPSVTASIFWLKAQAGWKDKVEVSAADGTAVYVVLPDNGRDANTKKKGK